MSGKGRYLLDTNAVVSLLNGNHPLAARLDAAGYVGISIITYLEFLAFDGLSQSDRDAFEQLVARVDVVPLAHDNNRLIPHILALRTVYRLKLPDAIIGATAIAANARLITNDGHFSGIPSLAVDGC